jgi:hypothetical protein
MKKLLFLTAIAILTFNSSIAQDDTDTSSGSDISFGVKAGANFAALSGNSDSGQLVIIGLNIGAVVNIGISEKFSIQPEVVYSAQGTSEWGFLSSNTYLELGYINIPVMAGYEVLKGLTIQAGPQVGFNLSAKYQNNSDYDVKDIIEPIDFGVAFGAQYELHFGMFFQARYALGLNNIYSITDKTNLPMGFTDQLDVDSKNMVLSLSVGYFFN